MAKNSIFIKSILVITVLFLSSQTSSASNHLSIRGIALGMKIEDACNDAEITKTSDQLLELLEEFDEKDLVKLRKSGFINPAESRCERRLGVPDGISANQDKNDRITAIGGKIVAVFYDINNLNFDDGLAVLSVFKDRLGQPKRIKSVKGTEIDIRDVWGNESSGDKFVATLSCDYEAQCHIFTHLVRNPDFRNLGDVRSKNKKLIKAIRDKKKKKIIEKNL